MRRNLKPNRRGSREVLGDRAAGVSPPYRRGWVPCNEQPVGELYRHRTGCTELRQTFRSLKARVREIAEGGQRFVEEKRHTLLVLHSACSAAAAVDLESKCSEAGLRNVLLSDYRHFAHGRHYWLAKHAATSAVVACITPSDGEIAHKTLRLLPIHAPILRLQSDKRDGAASIELLIQAFQLVSHWVARRTLILADPAYRRSDAEFTTCERYGPALGATESNLKLVAVGRKQRVRQSPMIGRRHTAASFGDFRNGNFPPSCLTSMGHFVAQNPFFGHSGAAAFPVRTVEQRCSRGHRHWQGQVRS